MLTPAEGRAQPAPAALPRLVLQPRSGIPSRGAMLYEASTRVQAIHPSGHSPRLQPPGWNRPPLGLSPELRTPPTKSRTTHVGAGTGHEHGPGTTRSTSHRLILQSVVHSLRATSRRSVLSISAEDDRRRACNNWRRRSRALRCADRRGRGPRTTGRVRGNGRGRQPEGRREPRQCREAGRKQWGPTDLQRARSSGQVHSPCSAGKHVRRHRRTVGRAE